MNNQEKLEEIEGADFPSVEYDLDTDTLEIEVITELPLEEIDSKIIEILSDRCNLTLLNATMENKFHLAVTSLALISLEDRFWITYHVEPKTDHQIIIDKLMKSWGTEIFVETIDTDIDKLYICFITNLSLDRVDSLFRKALEDFDLIKEGSDLPIRDVNGYGNGVIEYKFNKILQSNNGEIYEDIDRINEKALNAKVSTEKSSCPDCKDGFYYPLIGSPEPCRTCK